MSKIRKNRWFLDGLPLAVIMNKQNPKNNSMKTYKLIITILTLSSTLTSFGQINPINDLYYQQTYWYQNYNCPGFNCFELSWSAPDSSNDTLLGYNVYRNSDLWIFTENTDVTCSGYSPCDYTDFYDPLPFWVTVKAVYNNDSLLSIANDSVFVNDLMININEIENDKISLFKNPISIGENISILIPNFEGEACSIQIHSLNGQLIKGYEIKQVMNGVVNFSTKRMTQGLYLISIQLKGRTISQKIMIK
ncbi:MAG: T9SS type A sorting domain-containing protein [Bacteroidales bacterium]|nr:T9SS type A sorting domain-containing protein [Bacteroidales bacterium]